MDINISLKNTIYSVILFFREVQYPILHVIIGVHMDTKIAFGKALRRVRKTKGLKLEDFGTSRSYVGSVERGQYSPTLDKIDDIAQSLGVHPASLVIQTYLSLNKDISIENLVSLIKDEISGIDCISDITN